MKNRKICAILIAVAFVVSALFSFVLLSRIQRVEVEYTVSAETDTSRLQNSLDSLKGNLLWVTSDEDAEAIIKDYPYFYFSKKAEKVFPNTIRLTVCERREVYRLIANDKVYLLNEEGILLSIEEERAESRELITLKFDGIDIKSETLGKRLVTDDEELFDVFLKTAEAVELTDNIKSVTVLSKTERRDFLIETYTGVTIEIPDADDCGMEKTLAAFSAYNESTEDYYKAFCTITVVKTQSGEIDVQWTEMPR